MAADPELLLIVQLVLLDPIELDPGAVRRAQVAQHRDVADDLDRRVLARRLTKPIDRVDGGRVARSVFPGRVDAREKLTPLS